MEKIFLSGCWIALFSGCKLRQEVRGRQLYCIEKINRNQFLHNIKTIKVPTHQQLVRDRQRLLGILKVRDKLRRRVGHGKLLQLLGIPKVRGMRLRMHEYQISRIPNLIQNHFLTSNWSDSWVKSISGDDSWVAGVVSTWHVGLWVGGVDGLWVARECVQSSTDGLLGLDTDWTIISADDWAGDWSSDEGWQGNDDFEHFDFF